jgi:carboxymethylenebutenolidase
MTTQVSFKSKSGSNVHGELAEPSGSGKAPCVVLIQEWWGVNDHIKDLTERMAKEGFLVVAPDLYHGKTTKNADEAGKMMTELDTVAAVGEIAGAVAFLKEHPRSNGKVGVMGFCMGGALSFATACFVDGLGAVASFYGVPPAEKVDYGKVTAPVIAHVAKKDQWVTQDKVESIKKQVDANAKHGAMEIFVYDADHAFVNNTRPEVHSPDNAKLAWSRTVDFFKKKLA